MPDVPYPAVAVFTQVHVSVCVSDVWCVHTCLVCVYTGCAEDVCGVYIGLWGYMVCMGYVCVCPCVHMYMYVVYMCKCDMCV